MTTVTIPPGGPPGVRQAAGYAVEVMLTRGEYGTRHGFKERTMQRYLAEGRIPGAVKDERGQWRIPADAPVLDAPATTDVVRQAAPGNPQDSIRLAYAIPLLVPLVEAAALLGTDVAGVRRMGRDGVLRIGRYGPYQSLRVVFEAR